MNPTDNRALGYLAWMREAGGATHDGTGSLFSSDLLAALADVLAETERSLTTRQIHVLVTIGAIVSQAQIREQEATESRDAQADRAAFDQFLTDIGAGATGTNIVQFPIRHEARPSAMWKSPSVLALKHEVCAEAEQRDLLNAELFSAADLYDTATAELVLLIAELERPTVRGVEQRRAIAITLAADLMRRKAADANRGAGQ